MLITFHKPYGVLSQFNENPDRPGQRTLVEFDLPPNLRPVGRLDQDSEGLLLLTDEKEVEHRLLHPRFGHQRCYLTQVEGVPEKRALERLRRGGLEIRGYRTLPCEVRLLDAEPPIPPRDPPVQERRDLPNAWLQLDLREGKNRQVRRMTAAVGYPTLRLIRIGIGGFPLGELSPGEWRELNGEERATLFEPKGRSGRG